MPYIPFFNGTARGKGDVVARSKRQRERREQRRIERAARKAERDASGISGPEIDWHAAISAVADTPIEGLTRTLSRGDRQ